MHRMTLIALSAGLLVALTSASMAQALYSAAEEFRRTNSSSCVLAFVSVAAIVLYLFK